MDPISLKCPSCQQPLKFPAGRAGTKAKCTRCNSELTVPQNGQAAAPPAPAPFDDDDGPKTYGLLDVAPTKKKVPLDKKKKDKAEAAIQKRKRTLQDAREWNIVRKGLVFWYLGAIVWLGVLSLNSLVSLMGAKAGPEFNVLREKVLIIEPEEGAPPGAARTLDITSFVISIVSGSHLLTFAKILLILCAIGGLVQAGCFMLGYFTCAVVPERYGAKAQIYWLIILGGLNAIILVVFRLMPLLGSPPLVVPYLVPEIPMVEANIERGVPLHIFWSGWPFIDMVLTLTFVFLRFAETTLAATFLRSVGLGIKEEPIKDSAAGLAQLSMGTAFILIAYYLVSLDGSSDVLITILRCTYLLAVAFQFFLAFRFLQVVGATQAAMNKLLADWVPPDNDDNDDEDSDDRPKAKKKKRREEEDDDDDDDDKPRKRKQR